ncbi:MAG: ribosome-associated translation inhibitor RaiA [Ignavibacteriales bacterium]|nr:ribosome-associated translation inhibitor RaiA [Ignavibacteriales bacterium]
MTISVTSRHFKAHQSLVEYAEQAVKRLGHFYDGIIKCDVVLSYENPYKRTKIAEVIVSVYRSRLTAEERSDDFFKSVDGAMGKVLAQLKKYKGRLHHKDRQTVRKVNEKV